MQITPGLRWILWRGRCRHASSRALLPSSTVLALQSLIAQRTWPRKKFFSHPLCRWLCRRLPFHALAVGIQKSSFRRQCPRFALLQCPVRAAAGSMSRSKRPGKGQTPRRQPRRMPLPCWQTDDLLPSASASQPMAVTKASAKLAAAHQRLAPLHRFILSLHPATDRTEYWSGRSPYFLEAAFLRWEGKSLPLRRWLRSWRRPF